MTTWRSEFQETIIKLTHVCDELDRLAVTTDDEDIARVARSHYQDIGNKIVGIKRRILKEDNQND